MLRVTVLFKVPPSWDPFSLRRGKTRGKTREKRLLASSSARDLPMGTCEIRWSATEVRYLRAFLFSLQLCGKSVGIRTEAVTRNFRNEMTHVDFYFYFQFQAPYFIRSESDKVRSQIPRDHVPGSVISLGGATEGTQRLPCANPDHVVTVLYRSLPAFEQALAWLEILNK